MGAFDSRSPPYPESTRFLRKLPPPEIKESKKFVLSLPVRCSAGLSRPSPGHLIPPVPPCCAPSPARTSPAAFRAGICSIYALLSRAPLVLFQEGSPGVCSFLYMFEKDDVAGRFGYHRYYGGQTGIRPDMAARTETFCSFCHVSSAKTVQPWPA